MRKRVCVTVLVMIYDGDKILLQNRINKKTSGLSFLSGHVEDDDSIFMTAIREVKEETGIEVSNLEKVGNIIIEYPDRIYNMNVFVTSDYSGNVRNNEENDAFFIDKDDLLKEKKKYAITLLLDNEFKDDFNNRNINVKFNVDNNHRVINYISIEE